MRVKVYAVVVTYFPESQTLKGLIDSLVPQVEAIVVVDNTPTGGSGAVAALDGDVARATSTHILSQGRNLGVAAALNVGIAYSAQQGCSHVLLSDQDSSPHPGMVQGLLDAEVGLASQGRRVAALGPVFVNELVDRPFRFLLKRDRSLLYRYVIPSEEMPVVRVVALITSGTLIPMTSLQAIGPMLDELFIDYVDIEWCHRASAKGYDCYAVHWAKMGHQMGEHSLRIWLLGSRNIGEYSPLRLYYQFRNSMYLTRLMHVDLSFKLAQPWFWLGKLYAYGFFSRKKGQSFLMMMKGLRDGWSKRLGAYLP